jgi:hypothetical protein
MLEHRMMEAAKAISNIMLNFSMVNAEVNVLKYIILENSGYSVRHLCYGYV